MNKKTFAIGVLVMMLFLLGVYLSQDSSTPPGQTPLATLTAGNFGLFEEAFDKSPDGARLVLLLSPT